MYIVLIIILIALYYYYIKYRQSFNTCNTCIRDEPIHNISLNPFIYPYSGSDDIMNYTAQSDAAILEQRRLADHSPLTN